MRRASYLVVILFLPVVAVAAFALSLAFPSVKMVFFGAAFFLVAAAWSAIVLLHRRKRR